MRARAGLLLALIAAGILAGCFGTKVDCPSCATPTDKPAVCPACAPDAPKPPDLLDAGYVLPGTWQVGDGWDYRSNQSHFRDIRVVGEATVNGTRYLRVRDHTGIVGNPPQLQTESWLDPVTLGRRNLTFLRGILTQNFTPSNLETGFLRNGTYRYNETTHDKAGTEIARWIVTTNVHYLNEQVVRMSWGFTNGGVIEYRSLRETVDGTVDRQLLVRQVSKEWLNDVLRLDPTGEQWELKHAKVGDHLLAQLDPFG